MTEWRPIAGYPEYEVSDTGQVRHVHVLSARDTSGYAQVYLVNEDGKKQFYIHILVAQAFLGDPQPGEIVRHGLGGRDDNSVTNLSYGTYFENNVEDRKRDGTFIQGSRSTMAKLSEDDVILIRKEYDARIFNQRELAAIYNVTYQTIGKIVRRERWKHV